MEYRDLTQQPFATRAYLSWEQHGARDDLMALRMGVLTARKYRNVVTGCAVVVFANLGIFAEDGKSELTDAERLERVIDTALIELGVTPDSLDYDGPFTRDDADGAIVRIDSEAA